MTVKPKRRSKKDGFQDVRKNGRLLFRYDPKRQLVEIKQKGQTQKELIDLRKYND